MKKEVILVPKDKCPLDVLAEMGERTKNSWIFLHQNAVDKLTITADESREVFFGFVFYWKSTKESPETSLKVDIR